MYPVQTIVYGLERSPLRHLWPFFHLSHLLCAVCAVCCLFWGLMKSTYCPAGVRFICWSTATIGENLSYNLDWEKVIFQKSGETMCWCNSGAHFVASIDRIWSWGGGLDCDMVDHWWSLMNGQMTPNCVVARHPDGRRRDWTHLAHNVNLNTTFECCVYHNLEVYQV